MSLKEPDDKLVREIAWIVRSRRDETVRLLRELVRTPSVTGSEGSVQEVVERAFRERGLDVDRWEPTTEALAPYKEHVGEQKSFEGRPNVVGVRRGRGGGRSILLNAHVDTVEPGDAKG